MTKRDWLIKYSSIKEHYPREMKDKLLKDTFVGQMAKTNYFLHLIAYQFYQLTIGKVINLTLKERFRDIGKTLEGG